MRKKYSKVPSLSLEEKIREWVQLYISPLWMYFWIAIKIRDSYIIVLQLRVAGIVKNGIRVNYVWQWNSRGRCLRRFGWWGKCQTYVRCTWFTSVNLWCFNQYSFVVFNLSLSPYFQMAKFLRVVSFMKEPSYTSEFLGKTLAEWLVYSPSVICTENSFLLTPIFLI